MLKRHVHLSAFAALLLAGSTAVAFAQGASSGGASSGGSAGASGSSTTGPTAPGPSGTTANQGTLGGGSAIAPGPSGANIPSQQTGPGGTQIAPGTAGSLSGASPNSSVGSSATNPGCDSTASSTSALGPIPNIMTQPGGTTGTNPTVGTNQTAPSTGVGGTASRLNC